MKPENAVSFPNGKGSIKNNMKGIMIMREMVNLFAKFIEQYSLSSSILISSAEFPLPPIRSSVKRQPLIVCKLDHTFRLLVILL
jgi:hypothetical protein